MSPSPFRIMAIGTALALASGCVPLRQHQGYIVDADLVNAIQPGVDNRASVTQTLASRPSPASSPAGQGATGIISPATPTIWRSAPPRRRSS